MHPISISNIKRPQQYTGSAQLGSKPVAFQTWPVIGERNNR